MLKYGVIIYFFEDSRFINFINFPHERFLMPNNKKLKRITITGPPCAGKSTIIKTFHKEFRDTIQCVPEIATMVITELEITPETKESSIVLTKEFGNTLYYVQQHLEKLSEEIAKETGKKALLLDKSCLDVAVHFLRIGKTLKEYENYFNTTIPDNYRESDLVLFIGLPRKDIYESVRSNNAARRETYEEAKLAEERYFHVWQNHPRLIYIKNNSSWEDCLNKARKTIYDFLAV